MSTSKPNGIPEQKAQIKTFTNHTTQIFFSFFNVLLETGNILMLCLLCEPYASTLISKIYHVFGENIFIEVCLSAKTTFYRKKLV